MTITIQSRKAKARSLQKHVRDIIMGLFTKLTIDDVHSTSMGAQGEDVMLSSRAREFLPIQVECKANQRFSIYKQYKQAQQHGPYEPVLIIRGDNKKALAVVDAKYFFSLFKKLDGENSHRDK